MTKRTQEERIQLQDTDNAGYRHRELENASFNRIRTLTRHCIYV